MIKPLFANLFYDYCQKKDIRGLEYKITSSDRDGDIKTNPHALPGNAMDISLRYRHDYAPVFMYNELFRWLMKTWPYRAGIDNTTGNIHIHLDMGGNRPEHQKMPFFFKEDNGKYQFQIKTEKDIERTS